MQKRLFSIVVLATVCCLLFSFAQQDGQAKYKYKYQAFLGCSVTDTIVLNKQQFTDLVSIPLCAKDSSMDFGKVTSFEITYAERGLYQDSTGLPIIFTDYSFVACNGDTIPMAWKQTFQERTYKGDTIYFDRIKVAGKDNKTHLCKRIKVVIQ